MVSGTQDNPCFPFPNLSSAVSDLNTLYQTYPDIKIVRISRDTLNAPVENMSGFCIHCSGSETWQSQIAMQVGNSAIYRRSHGSNGWSAWTSI